MLAFLDRDRSVAPPGYSRWLVPPAALAIHLSIGQVYSFSVFKNPLLALEPSWNLKAIGYVFSIAIGVLGLSAAVFGAWLERAGPRRAMFYSACCFGAGFVISSFGARLHVLALIYLGYGLVGGVGLGLGYISPVSTLIKWFPDRPGLSTGLAIMGFGGGAMIGGPLANQLMAAVGIASTFLVMGALYFAFMMFGVFTIRIPSNTSTSVLPSSSASEAIRTRRFWMLWIVLFTNVTAGIGLLEQASPMIQDFFKGEIGPAAAVGFVGLLSLFNMAGRFFWASVSDFIGRKRTYVVFFVLGSALFFLLPTVRSVPLFVGIAAVLLTMYGGGFATIPAYLKDQFGSANVSAIHGRLLTAWSTAGIVGPLIVNGILDHYVAEGRPRLEAYSLILHIMGGLLMIGLFANLLVRRENA